MEQIRRVLASMFRRLADRLAPPERLYQALATKQYQPPPYDPLDAKVQRRKTTWTMRTGRVIVGIENPNLMLVPVQRAKTTGLLGNNFFLRVCEDREQFGSYNRVMRTEVTALFGRKGATGMGLVGPRSLVNEFRQTFSDITKAAENTLLVSIESTDGVTVDIRLPYTVLTEIGSSAAADGMIVVNDMQFLGCKLPSFVDATGVLIQFANVKEWARFFDTIKSFPIETAYSEE